MGGNADRRRFPAPARLPEVETVSAKLRAISRDDKVVNLASLLIPTPTSESTVAIPEEPALTSYPVRCGLIIG